MKRRLEDKQESSKKAKGDVQLDELVDANEKINAKVVKLGKKVSGLKKEVTYLKSLIRKIQQQPKPKQRPRQTYSYYDSSDEIDPEAESELSDESEIVSDSEFADSESDFEENPYPILREFDTIPDLFRAWHDGTDDMQSVKELEEIVGKRWRGHHHPKAKRFYESRSPLIDFIHQFIKSYDSDQSDHTYYTISEYLERERERLGMGIFVFAAYYKKNPRNVVKRVKETMFEAYNKREKEREEEEAKKAAAREAAK